MIDKQTSDERLLKLIEGAGEPKHSGTVFGPGVRKQAAHPLSVKLNFLELKTKLKALKVNLLVLNKGLIGLAILLTLVFLYIFVSGSAASKPSSVSFTPKDSSAIIKLISSGEAQGLMRKNILNQNIKRDFFLPFGEKRSAYTQEEGPDMTEEVKALKLVGIIWSASPEVMIENSKDSRTYTLKKGESLGDKFKIKEVSRTSATLVVTTTAGSKEYELR
ncbi:MAG: hypothetical protein PHP73_04290 [Candidatus Omnitrophica bacterium]|nr:hypothetical protein [Candidatus Omnitrophota bacterium]